MGTPAWAEKPNLSPRIPPIGILLDYNFWVSKFEITREEYLACFEDNACSSEFVDVDAGLPGRLPISGINMDDAQAYVQWLSRKTGKSYRLLTGTEWEYAARGGATGIYATGKYLKPEQANFFPRCGGGRETIDKCLAQMDASSNHPRTIAQPELVGQYSPNGIGLYDVHGNVAELVSDCIVWDASMKPSNPSVWQDNDCTHAYYRGGYFEYTVMGQRLDVLLWTSFRNHSSALGFRIARDDD